MTLAALLHTCDSAQIERDPSNEQRGTEPHFSPIAQTTRINHESTIDLFLLFKALEK